MKVKESTHCKPEDRPLWKTITDTMAIFIAICVAIIYSCQLAEMVKSNEINRAALYVVQRAFVYMPELYSVNFMQNGKPNGIVVFTQWENTGNTAALHVVQYQNSDWRRESLPADFNFPDKPCQSSFHVQISCDSEATFIAPHSKIKAGPMIIPREQLEGVNKGQNHVYFWGWASYLDSFQCSHKSEFCEEIASFDGSTITFANCPEHNCTDQDCKDYRPTEDPICQAH